MATNKYAQIRYKAIDKTLNDNKSVQLKTAIIILSRYKHRAEFSWFKELILRIEQSFKLLKSRDICIIVYQENLDLKGRESIGTLFNLIFKCKQIQVNYEHYGKPQFN